MQKLYPLNQRLRRKSNRIVASRLIRNFVQNTSIHGIKYLYENTLGPNAKRFWLCILVLAFAGEIYELFSVI